MLTAVMRSTYQYLKSQRAQKQYELDKISRSYEDVTSKISNIQELADNNTSILSNNSAYASLQAMQQTYDTKKISIEDDLKELEAKIDSYKKNISSTTEQTSSWNLIA